MNLINRETKLEEERVLEKDALKIDLYTLYRVNNPQKKSFLALQGVHRCGGMEMEVESPQVLCHTTDESRSELQGLQKTTTKAIREVETLLQGAGLLIKVYDI
jgi:hypothetical protein